MWSADLSKSFSQLIVSIFVFSHYFFNRFCLVEKCRGKNRLNDFTSISIEFQYKRDLSVCSKLFIAFISLKWLVSPRCPVWHTFDSIFYIYTSKVIKYISPLISYNDAHKSCTKLFQIRDLWLKSIVGLNRKWCERTEPTKYNTLPAISNANRTEAYVGAIIPAGIMNEIILSGMETVLNIL